MMLPVRQVDEELAGVPDPPWRGKRGRVRRASLSRDAIVEAALGLLDRDGADELSMRHVAEELGVGAASLYWYVASKSELIDLIIERVTREVPLPEPDTANWQQQLRETATNLRRALASHRDVARLTLGRVPMGPTIMLWLEWTLSLLRGAGMPDRIAVYVGDLMALYVGANVAEEEMGLASPTGEPLTHEQIGAMFRDYMLALPKDRFPNVVAMVDEVLQPFDRFGLGLEIILRGLATYASDEGKAT